MDYSYSFQDNIPADSFNTASRNILEWISNNRKKEDAKDPNAYEMANLFLFGAKYAQEGKDIDKEALSRIWEIRSQDFERCNVPQSSFIYTICQDAYNATMEGKNIVNDENSHHALRKMAGIGLFLKQQQRDTGKVVYNNPQELMQLLQTSGSLKAIHPDLFERYAFGKNLDVLCRLQLSQELPEEVSDAIRTAQGQLTASKENGPAQNSQPISKLELCRKAAQNAWKVYNFMRKRDIEVDRKLRGEYKYTSNASNFYYSLYYELSHAMDMTYTEGFSMQDFEAQYDTLIKKYGIDVEHLQARANQITTIEKNTENLIKDIDYGVSSHIQEKYGTEPNDD